MITQNKEANKRYVALPNHLILVCMYSGLGGFAFALIASYLSSLAKSFSFSWLSYSAEDLIALSCLILFLSGFLFILRLKTKNKENVDYTAKTKYLVDFLAFVALMLAPLIFTLLSLFVSYSLSSISLPFSSWTLGGIFACISLTTLIASFAVSVFVLQSSVKHGPRNLDEVKNLTIGLYIGYFLAFTSNAFAPEFIKIIMRNL